MRKTLIIASLLVGACNSSQEPVAMATTTTTITTTIEALPVPEVDISKVKSVLLEEPKIQKVSVLPDAKFWRIEVQDDGTDRSGYASYVCEVLTEQGVNGANVRIVPTGGGNTIGSANC